MTEIDSESATVLIVDDEAALVELFSAYLESQYETKTATGGTEALALMDDSIDVAILDRRMPERSGDQVLRDLRAEGFELPVAMTTAVRADLDIITMPFDAYVTKPVSREALRAVVESLLRRREYDAAIREFFQLASKKSALEANSAIVRGQNSAYDDFLERLQALREELNGSLDELIEHDSLVELSHE